MCTIKRIYHEEVHYEGQEPSVEPRYELDTGERVSTVPDEELAMFVCHLEEQIAEARILQETREVSRRIAERYFKQMED